MSMLIVVILICFRFPTNTCFNCPTGLTILGIGFPGGVVPTKTIIILQSGTSGAPITLTVYCLFYTSK